MGRGNHFGNAIKSSEDAADHSSGKGKGLIAHELTHVVQQRGDAGISDQFVFTEAASGVQTMSRLAGLTAHASEPDLGHDNDAGPSAPPPGVPVPYPNLSLPDSEQSYEGSDFLF